jgi:DNA topoisomerase-6 subunit B
VAGRPGALASALAKMSKLNSKLKTKSPAEFFAENKNIAGFDNPGKSLYTTIRELVENGLDACEYIGELPEISIRIVETTKEQFNALRGVGQRDRVDASLYRDHETEKQQKAREAKERRQSEQERKKAEKAHGDAAQQSEPAGPAPPKAKRASTKKEQVYYTVTVRDNGSGMAHDDIPNMLGRVLSGTKYGVRQARGKFGLGSKMALIWSKMSTGMPVTIRSAQQGSRISAYTLDIDIVKNCPNVLKAEKLPNDDQWHGTELSVTIEGSWTTYRAHARAVLIPAASS